MNTTETTQPFRINRCYRGIALRSNTSPVPEHQPLQVTELNGPFSLIDGVPMKIAGIPGMALVVRKGSLWVTGDTSSESLRAGDRYVCQTKGVLTLRSKQHAELHISSS